MPASKFQYSWTDDSRIRGDAQEIGQALERLSERLGKPVNGLSAEDVVNEAADPDSPLHDLIYHLDDTEAAREHRKDVARLVLRSLRVTVVQAGEERQAIAYVRVRLPDEGPLYVPTSLAARREDLRLQMLEDARRGINGWIARYKNLEGADEVFELVDRAAKAIEARIRKAKADRSMKTEASQV